MSGVVILLIVTLVFYCMLSWVLPKVIAWTFERKFNAVIRIGCMGLPYFKLYDINITKKGVNIHIEEIGVQSSFLNSELTKLITLVVKDVRINKDIRNEHDKEFNQIESDPFDFRNRKIPHFVTTFAQFMAVHIYNVSAMFLSPESPGWLIHATASELHVDGSIVQNSRTLLVNVNMAEALAKVLKHPENKDSNDTCLGEVSFAIALEATLVAQGPLSFEV